MKTFNRKNIPIARRLRSHMTPQEIKLWTMFLKHHKLKFRRQQTILNYVVDFYCPTVNLVIEVDGWGHYVGSQPFDDAERDKKLSANGFVVRRYSNADINSNFDGVCQDINNVLSSLAPNFN